MCYHRGGYIKVYIYRAIFCCYGVTHQIAAHETGCSVIEVIWVYDYIYTEEIQLQKGHLKEENMFLSWIC